MIIETNKTTVEELTTKIEDNRARCVGNIFGIYDQLPDILNKFKEEGLSEDDAVKNLGNILMTIIVDFEKAQVPLVFQYISENKVKQESSTSRIIVP